MFPAYIPRLLLVLGLASTAHALPGWSDYANVTCCFALSTSLVEFWVNDVNLTPLATSLGGGSSQSYVITFPQPTAMETAMVIKGLEPYEVTSAALQLRCVSTLVNSNWTFASTPGGTDAYSWKAIDALPNSTFPSSNIFPTGYQFLNYTGVKYSAPMYSGVQQLISLSTSTCGVPLQADKLGHLQSSTPTKMWYYVFRKVIVVDPFTVRAPTVLPTPLRPSTATPTIAPASKSPTIATSSPYVNTLAPGAPPGTTLAPTLPLPCDPMATVRCCFAISMRLAEFWVADTDLTSSVVWVGGNPSTSMSYVVEFRQPTTMAALVVKGFENSEITVAGFQLRCVSTTSSSNWTFVSEQGTGAYSWTGVDALRSVPSNLSRNVFPEGYALTAYDGAMSPAKLYTGIPFLINMTTQACGAPEAATVLGHSQGGNPPMNYYVLRRLVLPDTPPPNCVNPTTQLTQAPTRLSSLAPMAQPSGMPTSLPSFAPASLPTLSPTLSWPTQAPTASPTSLPTASPSKLPTSRPSVAPTASQPTLSPSVEPTGVSTFQPSFTPSAQPSVVPTAQPSAQPSLAPISQPSGVPTIAKPILAPSSQPTLSPSFAPTTQPSNAPSAFPTAQPSVAPAAQPNVAPTAQPSNVPTTSQPSLPPTSQLTLSPSAKPIAAPSLAPTAQPSGMPTSLPSFAPASLPTLSPTLSWPTQAPSGTLRPTLFTYPPVDRPTPFAYPPASIVPSSASFASRSPTFILVPSVMTTSMPAILLPTIQPTNGPVAMSPSSEATQSPTLSSIYDITLKPTLLPTHDPTHSSSQLPTNAPTFKITKPPTALPTKKATANPTLKPSKQPTATPTKKPTTAAPSRKPTAVPSTKPTKLPTLLPSKKLTSAPTLLPTNPTNTPESSFPTFLATMAPLPLSSGESTNAPTTDCSPLLCGLYSGDPHLTRTRTYCDGMEEQFPVHHCTTVATLMLAESPLWFIKTVQDRAAMGRYAPTSISSVIFNSASSTRLVFDNSRLWPASTPLFNVTILETNTISGRVYNTAAMITGPDLVANIKRTVWKTVNGDFRQLISINVCSSIVTNGLIVDGCPAAIQFYPVDSKDPEIAARLRRRLSDEQVVVFSDQAECDALEEPYKTNCNVDAMFTETMDDRIAISRHAKSDEDNRDSYQRESLCQWSKRGNC